MAAVLVVAALGVGVAHTMAGGHTDPGVTTPAPMVPAVPTTAPPAAVTSPSAPAPSGAVSAVAEPVNEGAGDDTSGTDAGRDAGPSDPGAGSGEPHWRPIAAGFAAAFTTVRSGDTTDRWRARLRPYVTAAVDKRLATVDVANVPARRFDGLDVLDASDEQISVQATYTPGRALVLYLVSDGNNQWKVSGYDRLEQ
ncbi:hypothetical protein [Microlunatus ginsengisoli]|uniref:hypothetical protein n=1 Tax=Microlunatus ginsengisoli TaxID=363863 RepID=UPI0031E3572E